MLFLLNSENGYNKNKAAQDISNNKKQLHAEFSSQKLTSNQILLAATPKLQADVPLELLINTAHTTMIRTVPISLCFYLLLGMVL